MFGLEIYLLTDTVGINNSLLPLPASFWLFYKGFEIHPIKGLKIIGQGDSPVCCQAMQFP